MFLTFTTLPDLFKGPETWYQVNGAASQPRTVTKTSLFGRLLAACQSPSATFTANVREQWEWL